MRLNFYTFFRFVALCLVGAGASLLYGQAPLVSDQLVASKAEQEIALDWRIEAADRAARAGLVGLAESGYRSALKDPSLKIEREDLIRLRLASALIAQRRFAAASGELDLVSASGRDSQYHLYRAIATYADGKVVDRAVFFAALKEVKPAELNAFDLPWLHLVKGLNAELIGQVEKILPAFERAVRAATSDEQKALFRSLVFRQKMRATPSNEALAAELRTQLDALAARAAAYTYARQYAVILSNLGRIEEAIEVIDRQRLNNKELSIGQREQLLLLKAVIAEPSSLRGTEALQRLVRSGKTKDVMRVALQLLARVPDAESGGLTAFLDQLTTLSKPHPLLGEIYYIRSQLALARAERAIADGDTDTASEETIAAEADAQFLLEQFPGLKQITNVYRLLAFASIQREPRQYRAAADFLIQLRDQTEAISERVVLNRLIGDCYFLNGDYENAVDFYQAAYSRSIDTETDDGLFLRLITAEVRVGLIDSAIQHIDEADFSGKVSVTDRWRAEWNVAQALKANGQLDVALARVRLLFEGIDSNPVPTILDFRLSWLEAYLSYLAGESEDLAERVGFLLARVESVPEGTLLDQDAKLLITELLLLKAQVLIRSGSSSEGVAALERLRVGFADSAAAQRSYLTESDFYASINDFEAAQATLSELASTYPESKLAPQALFEAAIYCERRGAEFYEAAVLLHDQIAERYPSDTLIYAARLKQGDLLRKMNKFSAAQIIYENLINSAPTHPRRYIPELSRVDCMLAVAKNNNRQLGDVVISLERLIDIPNLPVDFQTEIGYKLGFALMKRGEDDKAKDVFILVFDLLLDSEQAVQLGVAGRYWMSRVFLALGGLLEESGDLLEAGKVYRKMVAFNLPGRNLALDRANSIQILEESVPQ
ncbi:MAG: tetratricopeptide repeat protein [Opitutaceae bacterium]